MNTPIRSNSSGNTKLRVTPYNNRRKSSNSAGCFAPFKSPSTPQTTSTPLRVSTASNDKVELAKQVVLLQEQIQEKDKEINELSKEYSEDELQKHIDMLHEYNEMKDIAQMVIGKLAEVNGTTTKEMYTTFNLDVND